MPTAPSPTTELGAVNIMLSTIGEAPINSLDATDAVDAVMARAILNETLLNVLEEGWHFNTEEQYPLVPEATTGEIRLPANCIECDVSTITPEMDVAVRSGKLYDKKTRSFKIGKPVNVDMTLLLGFEDIPQVFRHYITVRAARVFQQRVVGSQILGGFTERDEVLARMSLGRYEANTADYNYLSGNTVMNILNR